MELYKLLLLVIWFTLIAFSIRNMIKNHKSHKPKLFWNDNYYWRTPLQDVTIIVTGMIVTIVLIVRVDWTQKIYLF